MEEFESVFLEKAEDKKKQIKIRWRKPSIELSRCALIVYLLLQEEGIKCLSPSYIESGRYMTKGAASKAIKELREKGYLDGTTLILKDENEFYQESQKEGLKNYLVYRHTFPNGKVYIGITSQLPSSRWKSGKGYDYNEVMYKDILFYGWDNIQHEILFDNLTKEEARSIEIKLIAEAGENYNRI